MGGHAQCLHFEAVCAGISDAGSGNDRVVTTHEPCVENLRLYHRRQQKDLVSIKRIRRMLSRTPSLAMKTFRGRERKHVPGC